MNSYDTICHEHLEYYSLAVIEYILREAGLKLVNVSLNTINGGTIRCYATHARQPALHARRVHAQHQGDAAGGVRPGARHRQAVPGLPGARQRPPGGAASGCSRSCTREGKRIHIYGASTKGNTILQWCGIDNRLVEFAAERNPDKYGARTLGTDIPIVSEEESRRRKPDYYLVLPWHFREEFLEREKAMLAAASA